MKTFKFKLAIRLLIQETDNCKQVRDTKKTKAWITTSCSTICGLLSQLRRVSKCCGGSTSQTNYTLLRLSHTPSVVVHYRHLGFASVSICTTTSCMCDNLSSVQFIYNTQGNYYFAFNSQRGNSCISFKLQVVCYFQSYLK